MTYSMKKLTTKRTGFPFLALMLDPINIFERNCSRSYNHFNVKLITWLAFLICNLGHCSCG